jgi:hypothetical protein
VERTMKQWAIKKTRPVLILLILSFASLLLGEISLRIYHFFNPLFIFYDDSYNRFRGKPNAYDWDFKLNSLGFKDTEFTQKKDRMYRILGLGDSFAFGVVPYRYNYLTLLESQLREESLNAEVFNMGIPSIGPGDYLALLVQEGLEYQPDMVLLSFFVGNDIVEGQKAPKWHSHSYLASLVRFIFTIRPKYEGQIIHGKNEYCDECPSIDRETYLNLVQNQSIIYLTGNTDVLPLFHEALDYLDRIGKICREKGFAFVVLIIPDEVQINPVLQQQVREQLLNVDNGWNITLPNEKLTTKLKETGIDYLDLYPSFLAEGRLRNLYKPRDTHWNIVGNQFAADIIYDYIRHYIQPPVHGIARE